MRLAAKARTEQANISTILKDTFTLGVEWRRIQTELFNTGQFKNVVDASDSASKFKHENEPKYIMKKDLDAPKLMNQILQDARLWRDFVVDFVFGGKQRIEMIKRTLSVGENKHIVFRLA